MENVLSIVGGLMIVATVLPLFKHGAWWIRVFDFPRQQITIISLITLAGFIYVTRLESTWHWAFVLVLTACILRQCYMIFPYTPVAAKQVQVARKPASETSCRLLFANVLMKNRNAARLREIIHHAAPDVILVVEPNRWWQEQLREFETTHPYLVHYPLENTYGMLLYSRFELSHSEIAFLIEDDIPSIHTMMKLPNGVLVELHCLHPRPPFPTEALQSSQRDAELLIVGRKVKATETPTIVLGDLNDVAWSQTNYLFQDISGLLDPRIGRGFFNTFHAKLPGLRFPLDHFFHSNHFRLIEIKRLPYFGSDHFPVFVALNYEWDAPLHQEELQADAEQEKAASERIAEGIETSQRVASELTRV
ncbi:MAG TPA: endonuclease/exonuclease/phosphatase family protein [Blastocatellia bacterium]|nr:endonuclease/exonuclease/phosphatase family protein [Blastocatellia bacterium]